MQGGEGRRLGLAVGLWLILGAAPAILLLAGLRLWAAAWSTGHLPVLVAALTWDFYLALLAGLYLAYGGYRGVTQILGFRWTKVSDLAVAWAAWLVTIVIGGLLTSVTEKVTGPPTSNVAPLVETSFSPWFVAAMVPVVVLVGPAAEELAFRGAIFGWLRTRFPLAFAVAGSAAVFAVAHLIPALIPLFFVFGVSAALVYQATGSTFNSFVMHATQNAVALAVTYLSLGRGLG